MSSNPKALGKAMRRGLEASGDLVRIVMAGAPPEQQQRLAREVSQGYQVRVVYGVLPSPYVAVESVEADGTVTELARKDLS